MEREIVPLPTLVWPPDVNFLIHEANHLQRLLTTPRQDEDSDSSTPALVLGDRFAIIKSPPQFQAH